ncbi:Lrp/AsnC family transcriptional regulator [Bosea lathyri]|uniref:Lrp/AsnC family transcriptional regulator n=1 Tax=Bosea lathyri TaxID=1036778 RepID=UPI00313C4353
MTDNRRLCARDLDRHDLAILDILQPDNSSPQRRISELVNISTAAVQRRISRLQKGGVISGNEAILNPAALGNPITVLVEVEIENERIDRLEAKKLFFSSAAEVQQC